MFFKLERGTIVNLNNVVSIFHNEDDPDDVFTISYHGVHPASIIRDNTTITKKDYERLNDLLFGEKE
jgi:hypothetical protein